MEEETTVSKERHDFVLNVLEASTLALNTIMSLVQDVAEGKGKFVLNERGAAVFRKLPTMQYYYRVFDCKSNDSFSKECICWHNQGQGPLKDRLPNDPYLKWRESP